MGGFAWVTLATNDSYSLGALVLAHSLKRVNTSHQLAVLITPAVSQPMKEQLQSVFDVVKVVDVLDSKDETNLALLKRPELGVTFTKIHCWTLTDYEKCVFLDADTLVVRNCDELFEREELSAAPDVGWPDCFNTGVFVYKPSIETFNNLVQLAVDKGSFDGGDQGLLNQYFSDWATQDIKKHLPFVYNLTSVAVYSYIPAFKHYGSQIRIVHFIGAAKPWLQQLDAASRSITPAPGAEHLGPLLQSWWDIFCDKVHPELSKDLECALGMLNLQVPDRTNANAVETSDEPGTPVTVEPITRYKEWDDSRQINLPYHPFEVKSTSGESLTHSFIQARELEILEKQRREEEERRLLWEQQQEEERLRREKEEEEKQVENLDSDDEGPHASPEFHPEPENQQNEEQPPPPPPPQEHQWDYHSFYPDESFINTYLEQNVNVYQPFDSHHHHPVQEPEPQQEHQPLPRFLTIPHDDPRQGHEWHPPPPPEENEVHYEPYVPPSIPPTPHHHHYEHHHHHHQSHENLHHHEIAVPENTEIQKSKSMTNLSEMGTPMSGTFWKSQPNVNVETSKKFAMPKLKPLVPKQSSPEPVKIHESRPKITLYTEFHMSSDYKDPVKLPKDNLGFVERQILKEKKKLVDSGKKFGALPYGILEPEIPEPPPPPKQKSPLKEIDYNENVDYDLSSCQRQAGNKPLPKDKTKKPKENTGFFLPELKPLVPEEDKREMFKKRESDERLQVPEEGRRKKKEKKDSRKARERKRKESEKKPVVAEVYKPTSDVNEILKRLVNYTKDYEEFFKVPEEKVASRKTPSPTIMINGKEIESEFSPIEFYDKEYYFKESASEYKYMERGEVDEGIEESMKQSPDRGIKSVETSPEAIERSREAELKPLKKKRGRGNGSPEEEEKKPKRVAKEVAAYSQLFSPVEGLREKISKLEVTSTKGTESLTEQIEGERKEAVEETVTETLVKTVQAEGEPLSEQISKVDQITTNKDKVVKVNKTEEDEVEEPLTEEKRKVETTPAKETGEEPIVAVELQPNVEPLSEQISKVDQITTNEDKVVKVEETEEEDAEEPLAEESRKVETTPAEETGEKPIVAVELQPNVEPLSEQIDQIATKEDEVVIINKKEEKGTEQEAEEPSAEEFRKVETTPAGVSELVEAEEPIAAVELQPNVELLSERISKLEVRSETEEVGGTVDATKPSQIEAETESEDDGKLSEEKILMETPEVSKLEEPSAESADNQVEVEEVVVKTVQPEVAETEPEVQVIEQSKIDVSNLDESTVVSALSESIEIAEEATESPNQSQIDEQEVIPVQTTPIPEKTDSPSKPTTNLAQKSEEPFGQYRSYVKNQFETSQKGLLGIPEPITAKTYASGMVISHALIPPVLPTETTTQETENVEVENVAQNLDSDSGVSTDEAEQEKNKPDVKDADATEDWKNLSDVTKSVAELVLNEPEEPMSESSKQLSYASVAQKTAPIPVPSTSQPRKSPIHVPPPATKRSDKKSSLPRKPKQPSQEKPVSATAPVSPAAPKPKTKKTADKPTEEAKKPSNIFEVLSDDSPDESVESLPSAEKISKKKGPKSTASKTKLVPSANLSAPRVNVTAEENQDSEIRLVDPNDNSGIAGAIAQLNLEPEAQPSAASTSAQDEYLRRQNWETGRIDYLGRDSFDNIWTKICETLEKKAPQ